jgi:hypothetical protein
MRRNALDREVPTSNAIGNLFGILNRNSNAQHIQMSFSNKSASRLIFSFDATLAGIELHHMLKKGQHTQSANQTIFEQFYGLAA